ncbi:ABC transporter substrate-binding protein [Microbacterium terricola]|uniref:ABC transporter substrate-binding protein n=1 Tax=Microbacterium terricola TaxID=344163 RepID=A0ABM8E268_9MICO|nr:extracellular solute-binding protein [Microbacterium terricola]UYK40407.1 extracellular solute-binding protein [Microbacterium terricola]BDV31875.1 ABC transporter substrate-binding protein [Microbacterium terricola]
MTTATRRTRRLLPALALVGAGAMILAGCSGSAEPSASGGAGDGEFSYLGQTENTTIVGTLETLASDVCSDVAETAALKTDDIAGTQWDQQLQLLASQDALSDMSMAAGTPSLMAQFIEAGQVLNLSDALEDLGVADKILPAAESTIKALYGDGGLYALPTEFNIEGFWYNKEILADNGIEAPETWDDLVDAAATLDAAGVQPFSAAGKDGWPVTRLVGDYIFRDLGADALQKVADGDAKLTDPEYVAAADAVAELGKAGYFGDAVGSVDYNAALNTFLTGKAAFFYMGSWALANFNDEAQNQIGADNVGFARFPAVEGGAGSIDEIPANVGIPVMFSQKGYDADTEAWLTCIAENYGDTVLNETGVVSGFAIDNPPADLPETTQTVQDVIANAPSSVLWFEALFTSKGTSISQTNGGALANGSLSGADFMALVQSANDEG